MDKYIRSAAIGIALLSSSTEATQYSVTVTAYSLTGHRTATGSRAGIGTIAVSRDLLKLVPYGSLAKLVALRGEHCNGYRTAILRVSDTMNRRFSRRVDVHLPTTALARSWGICKGKLVLVKKN